MIGQQKKEVVLRVEDPDPSHVGRNIITLDKRTKESLGVTSGDIIEITGTKKTAAVIWPARAEDEGKDIIRMDNLIRNNSGIGLGEKVTVRKAEYIEAKRVVLAPTQEVRIIASGYERILKKNFIGRPLNKGDNVWISVFGSGFVYKVVDTVPKGIVKITDFTQFILKEEPVKDDASALQKIAYEDIGGLEEQVQKIREMIELPMRHPEIFRKLGINPPKGVLLHGPPGTGKTLLAKAVANETQAHFIAINSPSVMSKFVGEAEERIRDVFKEAEKNAPSIIFFDEIDAIAPKRDEVIGEVERRVVAQILSAMDGMEARGNVIVIAATNRLNSIDEALRRPGRFDREIEIGVPTKKGRKAILAIHSRGMPIAPPNDVTSFVNAVDRLKKDVLTQEEKTKLISHYKKTNPAERKAFINSLPNTQSNEISNYLLDNFLDELAAQLHGFVGADLEALAKEAAMKALRRYLPKIDLEEETIPAEVLEALEVNKTDFTEAVKDVQPSALREVTIEVPNVRWSNVGGLEEAKSELKQAVEWPLKHPEQFKKLGITPPRGVLLYGPPGTGKTLLAKAVATESEANFISVKGPQLISMWVGESLPFDEELLVFDGEKIFREKIGKIVEEKKKLKVVTFDNDGKVFFSEITDFIKHPLNGKMLEITTKTGRKIKVTDKHSIFGLKNLEIEPMAAKELNAESSVIALPARIPNISIGPKEINLFEALNAHQKIMIKNVGQEIKQAMEKFGANAVANTLAVKQKYLYDIVNKNLPVNAQAYSNLTKKFQIKTDFTKTTIGFFGARNYIPTMLPLSNDLFRLIGQWVAEGDFNSQITRIHAFNKEIREDIIAIAKKLGLGNVSEFDTCITINSYIFAHTLKEVFGLKEGAFNKKAPQMLLGLDAQKAANFLKGYFSGDGTITKHERSYMVEAGTVSKELANDLIYVLLKFGIIANCKEKTERTGSTTHRIQIHGVDNFRKFLQIGFIDSKRNEKIMQNITERKWERSNVIPMDEKIKEVLNLAFGSYPNNNFVGVKKIRQALEMVDAQKTKLSKLWKLVEADIYWDKVQSIKEIDYKGPVYDISVEPCQNFLAGFGGIFAHNSERGIRKVFQRARQVSPTIIFFDEIDAIASSRGNSLDGGGSERVVNQLLTELDGIEALKDVVFIAATNRPDMIDPALLRPGRIDKFVKINSPDEKTRISILKVHSKKMSIASDVSIEEIAKKTEGYTGADIEGLLREAALISLERTSMKADSVSRDDIEKAMKKIRPSINKEITEAYEQFKDSQGIVKPSYVR